MIPWIQTSMGLAACPLSLRPEMVCIEDIAHALSQLCRYTGHSSRFYSVAEHAVHVSYRVPAKDALAGLMHDSAEAYLGDVAAPIKARTWLEVGVGEFVPFREVERRAHEAIATRLGFRAAIPPSVKEADLRMLMTEAAVLLGKPPQPWSIVAEPYDDPESIVRCWPPELAKLEFLQRYRELGGVA